MEGREEDSLTANAHVDNDIWPRSGSTRHEYVPTYPRQQQILGWANRRAIPAAASTAFSASSHLVLGQAERLLATGALASLLCLKPGLLAKHLVGAKLHVSLFNSTRLPFCLTFPGEVERTAQSCVMPFGGLPRDKTCRMSMPFLLSVSPTRTAA